MKLLPYDHFEIQTAMTREQAIETIAEHIEPKKLFRFLKGHTIFQGEISNTGFEISRIIHYRNSFLPRVRGEFQNGSSGTNITIRLTLHPFVTVFLCICAFLLFYGFMMTGNPLTLIMIFFAWTLTSVAFWPEAYKQKNFLKKILQ